MRRRDDTHAATHAVHTRLQKQLLHLLVTSASHGSAGESNAMTFLPKRTHRLDEASVSGFPWPPAWEHRVQLRALPQRALRLAVPCVGIDGCSRALDRLRVSTRLVNAYDIEPNLKELLSGHPNIASLSDLHLGPVEGDVTRVPLSDLTTPVDGLCSGPPCPPWAGNGSKRAEGDPRAQVFMAVINWVKHLVGHGLLFAVLENVVGIQQKINGKESFLEKTMRDLKTSCVEFEWVVRNLSAKEYGLAQERNRVFIVGVRHCVLGGRPVPAPLQPFGRTSLREFLNFRLPPTPREALTSHMKQNLKDYEDTVLKDVKSGALDPNTIVVFAVDRAKNKVYRQHCSVDCTPTLTTSNKYLWLENTSEIVNGVAPEHRQLSRFLHPVERLALQGFEPLLALRMPAKIIYKSTGNAYPVPLLGAILAPIVEQIALSEVLPTWPASAPVSACAADARRRALQAPAWNRSVRRRRFARDCGSESD